MDNQLYREIILEHWKNPQNFGEIENADIEIHDYNPLCGDEIKLTVNINDREILDIKFLGKGCAISIASASILTLEINQKKVDEFQKMTQQDFLDLLEIELTAARLKCALLSYSALNKALTEINLAK